MKRHVWNPSLLAAAVVALMSVAAPGQAAAQARRANPPAGPALEQDNGRPVAPAEIQRMLDGYELMQAQDTLQLGDEQFPKFLPRLKALQDARRRAQMERVRIVQELRRMSQARPSDVDESESGAGQRARRARGAIGGNSLALKATTSARRPATGALPHL